MNVLIIEDEQVTALHIKKMLTELEPGVNVQDILDSIDSAVNWFRSHAEPDLLLCDIQLADGVSFEIFRSVDISCPVIFTTAYDQYAIQAFRVNSIDYLLKPISRETLNEALKKFRRINQGVKAPVIDYTKLADSIARSSSDTLKRILIRYGETLKPINISDVAWFHTEEKIVFLTTFSNNSYPVDFSLDELEARLDNQRWFRINRQFIISFESIDKMTAWSKSRIRITLRPPCPIETVSSTERSGEFKVWLAGK
jgi:two-component system, LytTR family, response regulator LytT